MLQFTEGQGRYTQKHTYTVKCATHMDKDITYNNNHNRNSEQFLRNKNTTIKS